MNINFAAIYMKQGYKIRRTSWEEGVYIIDRGILSIEIYSYHMSAKLDENKNFITQKSWSLQTYQIEVDDLLADDWELINE